MTKIWMWFGRPAVTLYTLVVVAASMVQRCETDRLAAQRELQATHRHREMVEALLRSSKFTLSSIEAHLQVARIALDRNNILLEAPSCEVQ